MTIYIKTSQAVDEQIAELSAEGWRFKGRKIGRFFYLVGKQ